MCTQFGCAVLPHFWYPDAVITLQVERVFAQRIDAGGSSPVLKYLVKWEGLPYGEATWETEADVLGTGERGRVSGSVGPRDMGAGKGEWKCGS